jgi:SAM-dependent methyltransferase
MAARHSCDLCDGTDFAPIGQKDRRGRPLLTEVCKTCGLVSHALLPTEQELVAYYAGEYRRDYHGEYAPSAHRVVREWNRGRGLVQKLHEELRQNDSILEIGSGIGCTVINFALAGYSACGLEPHEGFRRYGSEKLHADVRPGVLDDLIADAQYDFILLVHALEHFAHPTKALTKIHALLRPGGRLYVEVPNFAAPHAAPGKQFHFAHIYNFTPATLRMLGAKTGFRVQRAYTAPFDKNIGLLLSRAAPSRLVVEGLSYAQTMAALKRYSTLSYHLRPMYLLDRLVNAARQFVQRCSCERQLTAILAQCDEFAARAQQDRPITPVRRAA